MTPHEFIHKWARANLSERSAYQQHFLDLQRKRGQDLSTSRGSRVVGGAKGPVPFFVGDLLGQPKPADADSEGSWCTFERGVHKTDGSQGWADVWMR